MPDDISVRRWVFVVTLAVLGASGCGSSGKAASGGTCDASKLPTQDSCVVSEDLGIFVSAGMGSAQGAGTRAQPMVSLSAAIAAAASAGKRVYACAEPYAEAIALHDGVSMFGYFDCAHGWAIGTGHARVAPAAAPAAVATNVVAPTRVEAFDLVAPDFTSGANSSIALLATGSSGLRVVDGTIHAGTGGNGAPGADGVQLIDSGTAKDGQDAWADGVCTGVICLVSYYGQTAGGTGTCAGEAGHDGGPGGNGGAAGEYQSVFFATSYIWNAVGAGVTAGLPATTTSTTAAGGALGLGGAAGAAGAGGTDGTSGGGFGAIGAGGAYVAADGTAGTSGEPGQGGGGSGAYDSLPLDYSAGAYPGDQGWAEPGPAGGAGGCPGLVAGPGGGGGASIGIVSLGDSPTLEAVTVETSRGGDGGAAGVASQPTAGGQGGHPAAHTFAGGAGGAGGLAGVSGNGGGGPSIGIAFHGTSPVLSGTTITPGAGGAGVAQRTVNGQSIPASADGLSSAYYSF